MSDLIDRSDDPQLGRSLGLSRRQLIRRSIGAGVGLWLLEVGAGTIGFLWPNLSSGFGGEATRSWLRPATQPRRASSPLPAGQRPRSSALPRPPPCGERRR